MLLNIPSSSRDDVLQDRFNRQVDEVVSQLEADLQASTVRIDELETRLAYVKAIPDTLTTVAEVVTYLQGV